MTLDELKRLSGINTLSQGSTLPPLSGSNISMTGSEKGAYMKKHNIEPGTDEWFRLWFALPRLTGENPTR